MIISRDLSVGNKRSEIFAHIVVSGSQYAKDVDPSSLNTFLEGRFAACGPVAIFF